MYEWRKNVLITGATHFLAVNLVERLVKLGANVRAFIRYDYYNDIGLLDKLPIYVKNKIQVIHGSLTNPEAIDYAVKDTDIVFHFGMIDMVPSDTNAREYLETTVIGTFNMLNSARKYKVKKLVHISTAEVYGKVKNIPINEECPLKALSPYVSIDISAEKLVEGYYSAFRLPVTIVRLFNVYGPMQSKNAIIPTIIIQGLIEPELLLGDMHAIRDFIYVDDAVTGLIKIVEIPESTGEVINLGSGQGISIGELSDKIIKLIGSDAKVTFDATRVRLQDHHIGQLVADITKAKNLLGWKPEVSLDSGLEQTIKFFRIYLNI